MPSEIEMKTHEARKQMLEARKYLDLANAAQEVGRHYQAYTALKQAIYLAQGAQVMEKSLADEKRVEALREKV